MLRVLLDPEGLVAAALHTALAREVGSAAPDPEVPAAWAVSEL
ncbi:hypothetical protein [Nocardia cyriacigeorgica]|nr:hypothetical protein [Nocardia cyriacigeorgica]